MTVELKLTTHQLQRDFGEWDTFPASGGIDAQEAAQMDDNILVDLLNMAESQGGDNQRYRFIDTLPIGRLATIIKARADMDSGWQLSLAYAHHFARYHQHSKFISLLQLLAVPKGTIDDWEPSYAAVSTMLTNVLPLSSWEWALEQLSLEPSNTANFVSGFSKINIAQVAVLASFDGDGDSWLDKTEIEDIPLDDKKSLEALGEILIYNVSSVAGQYLLGSLSPEKQAQIFSYGVEAMMLNPDPDINWKTLEFAQTRFRLDREGFIRNILDIGNGSSELARSTAMHLIQQLTGAQQREFAELTKDLGVAWLKPPPEKLVGPALETFKKMFPPSFPNVSEVDFDEQVTQAQKPVLVEFWSPRTEICECTGQLLRKLQKHYRETTESELERVSVVRVNIDENPGLAERYSVDSEPPVFILFVGKHLVGRTEGYDASLGIRLKEMLDPYHFNFPL